MYIRTTIYFVCVTVSVRKDYKKVLMRSGGSVYTSCNYHAHTTQFIAFSLQLTTTWYTRMSF